MVPIFLAIKNSNYSTHTAFLRGCDCTSNRLQCRVNVTSVCSKKQILPVPCFITMLALLPCLDPSCGISWVCLHFLLAQLLCACVCVCVCVCHSNTKTHSDTDTNTHTHWCTPPVPGQLCHPEHQLPNPRVVPSSQLHPLPKLTKSGRPTPGATAHRRGISVVPSSREAQEPGLSSHLAEETRRWH